MSRIAAIGERTRLVGYAAAGVEVQGADDDAEVLAAWDRLDDDVACLVLTARARDVLEPQLCERPRLVWAVLP